MRITIFGASGFIGQNLVDELSGTDIEVIATDIRRVKMPKNVKFIGADILDPVHVEKLVSGADVIVHLAASTLRTSLKNPKRNVRINMDGMINILEAARKYDVTKMIYSSASSVYGVPQYLPVDEEHPKLPTTVYGVCKYAGEHFLRVYHQLYGLNYFIFRFTNVYGPKQHPDTGGLVPVVLTKLHNRQAIDVYGDGSQTRDFVYVGDVVNFILRATGKMDKRNEIINLGSGKSTSVREVIDICAKAMGVKPKINFKPQEGGERKNFKADLSRCKKIFGAIPATPLDLGIEKTVKWLKSEIWR